MVVERWPHPKAEELRAAARLAQAAQAEIARTKEKLGLMQPADVDPNRTGLIGPDWSETTTTIGEVQAKRTATNPDLAAAIARILLAMKPAPGRRRRDRGCRARFVGANVAAISAVETLGLKPVIVSSLGSSMYGATDPEFGWLDMETAVRRAGHLARARPCGRARRRKRDRRKPDRDRTRHADRAPRAATVTSRSSRGILSELKASVMKAMSEAAPEGLRRAHQCRRLGARHRHMSRCLSAAHRMLKKACPVTAA